MKFIKALFQFFLSPHCFCCNSTKPICRKFEDGMNKDECVICDHAYVCHPEHS